MSALVRLMIAGAAAALFSAPVVAMDKTSKIETAQVTAQQGWRLSAVGCSAEDGKPADRPYDCELQA